MSTIINCTPHDINVVMPDGAAICYQKTSWVARVETTQEEAGDINGIPCFKTSYGNVTGFPDNEMFISEILEAGNDIFYIVSGIVKSACPNRDDLLVPDTGKTCIRDDAGKIIAVTQFIV